MPDPSLRPRRSRNDVAMAAGVFSLIPWGVITEAIGGLSVTFRFLGALAFALVASIVTPIAVAAVSRGKAQT